MGEERRGERQLPRISFGVSVHQAAALLLLMKDDGDEMMEAS
jgi:hypothetical protein